MRRFFQKWFLPFLFVVVIFIPLSLIFFPSPQLSDTYSTVVLDKDGELLGATIAADDQWRFPLCDSIPEKFIKAATQFEDHRFFLHPGIDPFAILRAIWQNIRSGTIKSGASTITMQVVRLSQKRGSRTILKKIFEMVLALHCELVLSKNGIMKLYVSHAPFGGNVVGLEAAAWRYFGCSPHKLTWAENAMLAVLPNSPALIHPGKNREKLKWKRDFLIRKLWKKKVIDSITCILSQLEPLPQKPYPIPQLAPHLLSRIHRELNSNGYKRKKQFKERKINRKSSYIKTTLCKNIQKQANQIILRHHKQLSINEIHNCAALIVEVHTGNILAYVGNIPEIKESKHGKFVDIITAPRSTGSILKPLLYACMINDGELIPTELVPDIPIRMGGFSPKNYTRTYEGAVPASQALARSLNVPAVHLLSRYGVNRFYAHLKKMGLTTLNRPAQDYGLALILGGAEGTLWDIVGTYVTMAQTLNVYFEDGEINEGDRNTYFTKLNYFYETDTKEKAISEPILEASACWLTLEALLEVNRPDAESAWRNYAAAKKIAWKTGTSYGFRDGWAVGVTPQYAIGVWVGNADGEGRPGLTGISTAGPILFELFNLFETREWFNCPEADVVETEVCFSSGYRRGQNCEKTKKIQLPKVCLRSSQCLYCKKIHCTQSLMWQVHSNCERVGNIKTVNWFVLPPSMEWFYKKKHSDYKIVPPYREDCLESLEKTQTSNLDVIYPKNKSQIYIPIELDGSCGRLVVKAADRIPNMHVFWHLDNVYIGSTSDIHHFEIYTKAGDHLLTLVDEVGEIVQRRFTIFNKN